MVAAHESLTATDLRDLRTVEAHAKAVLRQCEFLRHNGAGDRIRWGLIACEAWDAWRFAARADRRAANANGWNIFLWRMPRGFGRAAIK